MSATMIIGRVVLPASAVLLLAVVAWNAMQVIAVRAGSAGSGRGGSAPGAVGHPASGRVRRQSITGISEAGTQRKSAKTPVA